MAKGRKKTKYRTGSSGKSDTLAAETYRAKPEEIVFEEKATMEGGGFYDNAICLYGPVKIGKSKFASLIDGVYFLPTEIGYSWLKVRKTFIPNWVTFKKFVQAMERKPKLVKTVKMWCIDTVSNLSTFCSQYTCGRERIVHPSDQEWGKGWAAIGDEFMHWILRLGTLGPGLLFICHEKDKQVISHSIKITKRGPDLVKSHYNVINPMCDLILHMDFAPHYKKTKKVRTRGKGEDVIFTVDRCLFTKPTETRDAGDRTGLGLPDEIYFRTEKDALKKILGYFEEEEGGKQQKAGRRRKSK